MPADDEKVREQVTKVEALLAEMERLDDPTTRAKAVEVIQALLDLYGEGLARVMSHANRSGGDLTARLAADDLVSHLLLLHDLHPDDVETRLHRALDRVAPQLKSIGGNVQLLGVADGVVRLHLDGNSGGGPLSAETLKRSLEKAIYEAAPEIDHIESEGKLADEAAATAAPGPSHDNQGSAFVPLSSLGIGAVTREPPAEVNAW